MESRRYILAIGLSMIVLLVYIRFFGPKPVVPPPNEQRTQQAGEPAKAAEQPTAPAPKPAKAVPAIAPAKQGREITIDTDLVRASVNTAGGVITKWELKHYREADKTPVGLFPLLHRIFGNAPKEKAPKRPLGNVELVPSLSSLAGVDRDVIVRPLAVIPQEKQLRALASVDFRPSASSIRLDKERKTQTLVLTYAGPAGIEIEKKLTFHDDTYAVDVDITTKGIDGYDLSLGTDFGFADKTSSTAAGRVGLVTKIDNKMKMERLDKIKGETSHSGTIDWFGQEDKYFTATILYDGPGVVSSQRTAAPKELGDLLTTDLQVPDKTATRSFTLYAGPKSIPILQSFGQGMEKMVDYGWFGILARPMFWLMQQFYAITRNYGVAIILLTIVVRGLMFYPSLKSAKAMEEMKAIQPEMTALREKFKKDPQRMNQEMMKLYKEHKVNPLGGCLPMLMQFPFFVALYNVLGASIELRQAPFISFWIKDLSVHDPYYILPVLMGLSMIATMKITSATVDPKQQKMMMFMNIAFIFMFAWLPAGLLLYITLSNMLSIGQQFYVRRMIAAGR